MTRTKAALGLNSSAILMIFRLRHYVHIDDRVVEKFFNVKSLFKMTQDYSN